MEGVHLTSIKARHKMRAKQGSSVLDLVRSGDQNTFVTDLVGRRGRGGGGAASSCKQGHAPDGHACQTWQVCAGPGAVW